MQRRFSQLLVAGALICAIGGHWAILQSVAWIRMAATFAHHEPLTAALVKTFDGRHPCTLCKVVQAGQRAEKKHAEKKAPTKLDLFAGDRPVTAAGRPPAPVRVVFAQLLVGFIESPPTPPPRSLPVGSLR